MGGIAALFLNSVLLLIYANVMWFLIIAQFFGTSHVATKKFRTFANHRFIPVNMTVWGKVNAIYTIPADRLSSLLSKQWDVFSSNK